MSTVTYQCHEADAAARQLDAFLPAYEEVYAEPPYCEGPSDIAEFIEHYQVDTRRPGMRLILARDGTDVVGFTYGYHLAPDTRWWKNLQDVALPDDFTREDGRRTIAVIELAVRKPWRRHGIAGHPDLTGVRLVGQGRAGCARNRTWPSGGAASDLRRFPDPRPSSRLGPLGPA